MSVRRFRFHCARFCHTPFQPRPARGCSGLGAVGLDLHRCPQTAWCQAPGRSWCRGPCGRRRTAIPPPHRARNRHRCLWRDCANRRGSERRSDSGGRRGSEARSAMCERVPRPRMGEPSSKSRLQQSRRWLTRAEVVLLDAFDRVFGPSSAAIAPKQPTANAIAAIAPRREPTARQANAALRPGASRRMVLWRRLGRSAIKPGMLRERLAWRPVYRHWLIGSGETASAAHAFRSTMHVTHPPGVPSG